jgi:hypothetical protein
VISDDQATRQRLLGSLPWMRAYRCSKDCGWGAVRFSRSRFRQSKRKLKVVGVILLFFLAAAYTVRHMVMRAGTGSDSAEIVQ